MVGHSVPAQLKNTNSIVKLKMFHKVASKYYHVMHLQEAQKPDKKKSQNAICLQFQ
jgi:hypothetical protein